MSDVDKKITTQAGACPESSTATYKKGTLEYTKSGLAVLFAYLLWGDFCLAMLEVVLPQILPLQLRSLGAPNVVIGIMVSTLPVLCNLTVNPVMSFRSDNHRSRLGRRVPFLLLATPFAAFFLIMIGFAPDIGRFLHGHQLPGNLSSTTVVIGMIAIMVVGFQLFNYILMPMYYGLFLDVVPDALMARFNALFRVVSQLSLLIFNTFIFQHALTWTREIYIGIALIHFTGFMLVALKVKEGKYPPPAHDTKRIGLIAMIKTYGRECFSSRHYLYFYLRNGFWVLSLQCQVFAIFLFRDALGIPLSFIGFIYGLVNCCNAVLAFPMGMLADRYKPIRTMMITMVATTPFYLVAFFFIQGKISYAILTMTHLVTYAMIGASELPMYAMIPPKDRYGQFLSANQIVCSLFVILGSLLGGITMDWVTDRGRIVDNYRYLYIWWFIFQAFSTFFMVLLYRSWKRLGGDSNYMPPT